MGGSRGWPGKVTLPGMVVRGWGGAVATAAGAAAAAGAAQLGLGYGMDIISWPVASDLSAEAWIASLTWAAWIAASSTIIGAVVAARLQPAPAGMERANRVLWRVVLAAAAAVGAGATAVLVAVPARVAEVAGTSSPQAEAGSYALLGVVIGLVVAAVALTARAVAANLLATATWLWLLAAIAVVEGVLAGRDWARVPLGFFEFDVAGPWFRSVFLPDAGVAVGAALLIGALAALPAVRRGDPPIGVVLSGATGPLVLAAAYLVTHPELTGAAAIDLSRQLVVPHLVIAGLLGSLLVTAVPPRQPAEAPAAPVSPATQAAPAGSWTVPTQPTGPAVATAHNETAAGNETAASDESHAPAGSRVPPAPVAASGPPAKARGARTKARRSSKATEADQATDATDATDKPTDAPD